MVPSRLKNLFLFMNVATVGHKPALITTVSGSRGGAYPVVELRSSAYKNSRLCFVPEHLIVRQAEEVMNEGAAKGKEDEYIRARADFALRGLADVLTLGPSRPVSAQRLEPSEAGAAFRREKIRARS